MSANQANQGRKKRKRTSIEDRIGALIGRKKIYCKKGDSRLIDDEKRCYWEIVNFEVIHRSTIVRAMEEFDMLPSQILGVIELVSEFKNPPLRRYVGFWRLYLLAGYDLELMRRAMEFLSSSANLGSSLESATLILAEEVKRGFSGNLDLALNNKEILLQMVKRNSSVSDIGPEGYEDIENLPDMPPKVASHHLLYPPSLSLEEISEFCQGAVLD